MLIRDIAAHLGCSFEGDGDRDVVAAAALEEAGPKDLAFVASRKAADAGRRSMAAGLIVFSEYDREAEQTVMRSVNPRASFAAALALLYARAKPEAGIHPSAVIAANASIHPSCSIGPHVTIGTGTDIGEGTVVRAGCSVGENVVIGANSLLHARVTIYDGVRIGARAILHSGCVLGADGFGFALAGGRYEKFPQVGTVEIGNDVEIGANSCVDRAALGVTRIGNGVKLDNLVHIGHNCRIGNHVVIAAQTGLSGGVVVEDYAVIGGQVGIGDKARIESKAVLGSGSGVLTSKIVRSGQVVWGTPARPLREYLQQLATFSKLPQLRADVAAIKKRLG